MYRVEIKTIIKPCEYFDGFKMVKSDNINVSCVSVYNGNDKFEMNIAHESDEVKQSDLITSINMLLNKWIKTV